MSVQVCGDTHGLPSCFRKLNTTEWPEQKELCSDDLLIILGDFGLIFEIVSTAEEEWWLNWLLNKRCTVAFLDGNHENFHRLKYFPVTKKWGGNVQIIKSKGDKCIYHLMRGQVYTIEGRKIFTMGGAKSTDRGIERLGLDWWPEETPNYEEWQEADKNLKLHDNKVDSILTHTGPSSILKEMKIGGAERINDPTAMSLEHIKTFERN